MIPHSIDDIAKQLNRCRWENIKRKRESERESENNISTMLAHWFDNIIDTRQTDCRRDRQNYIFLRNFDEICWLWVSIFNSGNWVKIILCSHVLHLTYCWCWFLQPRTSLELEVAAMLKQDQPIVDAVTRPLSKVEEAALKAMSLQEVNIFWQVVQPL